MDLAAVEVQRSLQGFYGAGPAGNGRRRVSDVLLIGSGYEADVYAFSLEAEGRGAAEELVLRVYAGEGASEKAVREFAAMGRLREAGYPVPRVMALQRESSPLGRPFMIMERIDGVSMEQSHWSSPDEGRQALRILHCRLMARLHALEGSLILPDSPLAGTRDPYAPVDHELSHLSGMLGRLEGTDPPSLRDALVWLVSRRSEVPCERPVVVHGDFHRGNILLRADGEPFVIDWSNTRLADARSDLAWTRLIGRLISKAAAQADESETQLRLYERHAGQQVSMIEYFEVAACTRLLLSVLISLRFGADQQGMRPGAAARMRCNPDLLRYVATLLQCLLERKMPDLDDALAALLEETS